MWYLQPNFPALFGWDCVNGAIIYRPLPSLELHWPVQRSSTYLHQSVEIGSYTQIQKTESDNGLCFHCTVVLLTTTILHFIWWMTYLLDEVGQKHVKVVKKALCIKKLQYVHIMWVRYELLCTHLVWKSLRLAATHPTMLWLSRLLWFACLIWPSQLSCLSTSISKSICLKYRLKSHPRQLIIWLCLLCRYIEGSGRNHCAYFAHTDWFPESIYGHVYWEAICVHIWCK